MSAVLAYVRIQIGGPSLPSRERTGDWSGSRGLAPSAWLAAEDEDWVWLDDCGERP